MAFVMAVDCCVCNDCCHCRCEASWQGLLLHCLVRTANGLRDGWLLCLQRSLPSPLWGKSSGVAPLLPHRDSKWPSWWLIVVFATPLCCYIFVLCLSTWLDERWVLHCIIIVIIEIATHLTLLLWTSPDMETSARCCVIVAVLVGM